MAKLKPTHLPLLFAVLLVAMFGVGCTAPQADQGTSSGWTDAQAMDLDVNFNAEGFSSDAEAVEGDEVPAGRIVLNNSTVTINVTIGAEGQSEASRGDVNANNTPTVDTDVSGVPGVPGVGQAPDEDNEQSGFSFAAWFDPWIT